MEIYRGKEGKAHGPTLVFIHFSFNREEKMEVI